MSALSVFAVSYAPFGSDGSHSPRSLTVSVTNVNGKGVPELRQSDFTIEFPKLWDLEILAFEESDKIPGIYTFQIGPPGVWQRGQYLIGIMVSRNVEPEPPPAPEPEPAPRLKLLDNGQTVAVIDITPG